MRVGLMPGRVYGDAFPNGDDQTNTHEASVRFLHGQLPDRKGEQHDLFGYRFNPNAPF
jgi:hypothetical protein